MKKTLLSLLAAVFAMFLLAGCLQAKTKEYTWPVELINLSRMSQEETKKSIESVSPKVAEKITINDDGSVTLFCTEEQRLLWLAQIETYFVEMVPEYLEKSHVEIVVSDDRTSVELIVDPDETQPLELNIAIQFSISECYMYQLFSGIPQEECLVAYSIIDKNNGNVVVSETFPGKGFSIEPEDWE